MLLLLLARTAIACSCEEPQSCAEIFLREPLIASNDFIAMLPRSGYSCGEDAAALGEAKLLRGEEEEEVPVEVSSDEAGVYRLTPADGWVAGADYTLRFPDSPGGYDLSVGDVIDEEAPPTPRIGSAARRTSTEAEEDYYCGGWDTIVVVLADLPGERVYYEVELGDEPVFAQQAGTYRGEPTLSFGEDPCFSAPDLAAVDYSLRVRAIDAAGNASGWSEAVTVEAPPGAGCGGCGAGQGSAGGLLALLGLLARRRRG